MSIKFDELDLAGNINVYDCYEHQDLGTMTEKMNVTVPAHGTRIYRLTAETRLERKLYEAETAYLGKYQEIFNNQWYISAVYETKTNCSGGAYVGWLGSDAKNDLQWRNVFSDQGGEYTMSIYYMAGESRGITIAVNGEDVKTMSFNSGSWDTIGKKDLKITLKPGNNVIRLYYKSTTAWMPNIDCMTLMPTDGERHTVGIKAVTDSDNIIKTNDAYYTIDGRRINEPANGIYVHNGKKFIK